MLIINDTKIEIIQLMSKFYSFSLISIIKGGFFKSFWLYGQKTLMRTFPAVE